MDVPLFVVVNLLQSEALPQQLQKVRVSLVADLTGQQHHRGVRAQVLQSSQERREGVLQVNDVRAEHHVEPGGWVPLEALAPAQLGHHGGSLGVCGQVGLHVGREEVQSRFPVGDGHSGTWRGYQRYD